MLATLQTVLALMPLPRLLRALGLGSLDELLTAPLTVLAHLDDRDFLAQLEAVDDLRALIGNQARLVGTYFRAMVDARDLAVGRVPVGARMVDLADVTTPVLLVAGEADQVVPPRAVRAGARRLTGAHTRLTTAPGGHLGVLAGRTRADHDVAAPLRVPRPPRRAGGPRGLRRGGRARRAPATPSPRPARPGPRRYRPGPSPRHRRPAGDGRERAPAAPPVVPAAGAEAGHEDTRAGVSRPAPPGRRRSSSVTAWFRCAMPVVTEGGRRPLPSRACASWPSAAGSTWPARPA